MTPENFCYWLQGYFEIREASGKDKELLTQAQVNMIQEHLRLVFNKVSKKETIHSPLLGPHPLFTDDTYNINEYMMYPNNPLDEHFKKYCKDNLPEEFGTSLVKS